MKNQELITGIIKKYGTLSFSFFSFSFIFGLLLVEIYPVYVEEVYAEIVQAFSLILDFSPLQMILFIFLNNAIKVFLVIIFGIFLGIPTLLFLFVNGMVLGIISSLFYSQVGLFTLFMSLLPHGIFELPALFIGGGFGIWLGALSWDNIKRKRWKEFLEGKELKEPLMICINVFVRVIVPLLLIAAVIETALIFS